MKTVSGYVRKLKTQLDHPVNYFLSLHDTDEIHEIHLNPLIGQRIKIENLNAISCVACGRVSKKSFAQGYCYPCFTSLPECDICIMSPEKCHYQAGTCRDATWGDKYCMQSHYVYLASSSSVKVGITRASQIPTRWIDQGAVSALPIARVSQRYYSGLLEVIFKQHVSDRTSWQKMLKTEHSSVDLEQTRDQLFQSCLSELNELQQNKSTQEIELLDNEKVTAINYPVQTYPSKVTSFNLEKIPSIEARLMGIKGQYLIFDTAVINIRKYSGYLLRFSFA